MAATLSRPRTEAAFAIGTEVVSLQAAVQNYAWGLRPAENSFVADLYARNASVPIDDEKPYAELWIGTHPSGPAYLSADKDMTLAQFLEKNELSSIPYLLKVLSVAKPLSIQAHPDKQLAAQLHESNPKAYKDDNHKPEMCVALTEFEGMGNFRPVHEILAHLEAYPELADLCKGESALLALADAKEPAEKRQALKELFSSLMTSSEDEIVNALNAIVERLNGEEDKSDADYLFLRLVGYYPGDVGCFAAYLLNFVRIRAGEAFFMAANEPHAYLKGQCVEIMATSDNVVRAGLTGKFKDVSTLIDMLTYQDGPPTIMSGDKVDDYSVVYQPPAKEFKLTKFFIPPGIVHDLPSAEGPGMIMCLEGSGAVELADESKNSPHAEKLSLKRGSIFYVAPGKKLRVQSNAPGSDSSSENLVFFRAGVNES